MTIPPCPVETCNRLRRDTRPVCNRCMRRVGESVVHRWFGYKRAVAQHPGTTFYADRLAAVETTMVTNAAVYQQIRDTGQRPRWNTIREQWDNPRDLAREIILHHYPHLNVGTVDHVGALIADLYPAEP